MKRIANPAFSVPVSEQEKKNAESLRAKFEQLLIALSDLTKYMNVFFDQANNLEDGKNMAKLGPLITKYRIGLRKKFNVFVKVLEECLIYHSQTFSDTKLDNIRDLIIENTKSMRNSLIELLRAFQKVDDKDFLKTVKDLHGVVSRSAEQLNSIVRKEFFAHIDYDVLGKIRLGSITALPLVIRRG